MTSNATILSVCDDPSTNNYMRDLFSYFGYTLLVAEGLEDVQDTMNARQVDCILLDLDLVDGDTDEILDWLRTVSHSIPIVVTSYDADFRMESDYVARGVTDVLAKPLDSRMIARTIRILRECQKTSTGF